MTEPRKRSRLSLAASFTSSISSFPALEPLKSLGLYDNTLLFVTADHGEEFGEHELTRHGKTLFRDALHIPGILKLPYSRKAGERLATLNSNIDVAPSLLELAGLAVPKVFQGQSLDLDGDEGNEERRVFAELVPPST